MDEKKRLEVKRKEEMRTKAISRMIDEGGLGADNYYNIVKKDEKNRQFTSDTYKKVK
ncbi:MAG TPA: hypothetical protein VK125_02400 [Bacillota bacterium]|nr:hypothetical protein [Bacillota bacterium]